MILTALTWLLMMGLVVTWEKQMPKTGERFRDLPRRRLLLTLLVFPFTGFAGFACFKLIEAAREQRETLALIAFAGVAAGLGALLALALHHSVRAVRTRPMDPAREEDNSGS